MYVLKNKNGKLYTNISKILKTANIIKVKFNKIKYNSGVADPNLVQRLF